MADTQQPLLPSSSEPPTSSTDSCSPNSIIRHVTPEERALVNRCLNAVESKGEELQRKGMTKANFIFGVTNSLFIAWSIGAIPEHFWIVYLLEVSMLFPMRWRNQTRAVPLKKHFFWLDFCWVANFGIVISMVGLVFDGLIADEANRVSDEFRRWIFSAGWGIGCGPLLFATGLLGNSLLFHDLDNTAATLIHLCPSLVLYTMGWQHRLVHGAWPSIFMLDYFKAIDPWKDIFWNASTFYTIWLAIYTVWLLVHGMRLPSKGYDTIFHFNMRSSMGTLFAKCLRTPKDEYKTMVATNNFPRSYALLYMCGHALGVYATICLSLLLFLSKYIHFSICALMTFVTIYNGASRYTFYIIKSYGIVLRKELGIPLNRHASALVQWEVPGDGAAAFGVP